MKRIRRLIAAWHTPEQTTIYVQNPSYTGEQIKDLVDAYLRTSARRSKGGPVTTGQPITVPAGTEFKAPR